MLPASLASAGIINRDITVASNTIIKPCLKTIEDIKPQSDKRMLGERKPSAQLSKTSWSKEAKISQLDEGDDVDVEEVSSKEDAKQNETFVAVIAQAVLSAAGKRMTLSSIYHYIAKHFPHFDKDKGPGWRNSVRHNLSSNDCFVKAGRAENGKGHYWMIHPKDLPEFSKGNFRRRRKPRRPRCSHTLLFNGETPFIYHSLMPSLSLPYRKPQEPINLSNNAAAEVNSYLPYSGLSSHYGHYSFLDHESRVHPSLQHSFGSYSQSSPYSLWPNSEFATRSFQMSSYSSTAFHHQPCACHR